MQNSSSNMSFVSASSAAGTTTTSASTASVSSSSVGQSVGSGDSNSSNNDSHNSTQANREGGGGGGIGDGANSASDAANATSGDAHICFLPISGGNGNGNGGNTRSGHSNSNNNNNNNNNGNGNTKQTNGFTAANNSTDGGIVGDGSGGDGNGSGVRIDPENNHDDIALNAAPTANHNVQWEKADQETIRLIGQYLQDIGLDSSVKTLMAESGCRLEHPAATKFREHVLSGEWNKADAVLKELEPLIENGKPLSVTEMKFILLEQKYLEYLDDGSPLDALHVLRNELTPLQHNISRVHQLSSYMMCSNNQDLYQRAKWEGKGILSRALVMERLQSYLPPTVMMPPRRLRSLLRQAVELQAQNCPCHDMAWETNLATVSLLSDHRCSTDGFPMHTVQILSDHCDEVWFCKFSPNGLKLATGSKDSTVIIWDVDPFKLTVKHRRVLDAQSQMSVAFVSWSPNSKLLLVGGPEDSPEICLWDVDEGKLLVKMSQSMEDSLSCGAFCRDGSRFVCGGQKGQFYLCDLEGNVLESWEGVRINSVTFRSDNKSILAADSHYRIRGYNFDNPRSDFDILKESHPIMSFTINSADRLALLNISNQGLHLWDLEDKCLVRRFQGIRQSNFAIHSCFGGINESFVASGSEDKLIYIWHVKREEPLAKLSGHTKTVNCVSWNPVYPSLIASASDDATVRIWGPKSRNSKNASTSVSAAAAAAAAAATSATTNTFDNDECMSCLSPTSWNMSS